MPTILVGAQVLMQQATVFKITLYLTPLAIGLHILCAALFFKSRSLRKEYPFFFFYLLFQTLSFSFLDVLYYRYYFLHKGSFSFYYYSYWVQGALGDIFTLAIFKELFCAAFKPFSGLRDMAQVVFRWAAAALVLIGIAVACFSSLPFQHLAVLVVDFERVICIMQCVLLLFLFMGSNYLGLSMRSHVFGLTLGFGVMATANLLFYIIVSFLGYEHTVAFKLLPTITFVIVPAIWAFYVARTEPARDIIDVPLNSPLLRWNEAAMAFGHSGRVAYIEDPKPFMPEMKRIEPERRKKHLTPIP